MRKIRTDLEKLEQRFWKKVDMHGPQMPHALSCCWQWKGAVVTGYGKIHWHSQEFTRFTGNERKLHLASRISWLLAHKEYPTDEVLHTCNNKLCVRPSHMKVCSRAEVMRHAKDNGLYNPVYGENQGLAKLTDALVLEYRRRWIAGEAIRSIARNAPVSRPAVTKAIKGETWKHLNGLE